jgi:hypothetical protein
VWPGGGAPEGEPAAPGQELDGPPLCLAALFQRDPLLEAFILVHDGPSPCWEWTGQSQKSKRRRHARYGRVRRRRLAKAPLYVHRYVYTLLVGAIPEGHEIHHSCKRTLCCNPAHMLALSEEEHDWYERESANY